MRRSWPLDSFDSFSVCFSLVLSLVCSSCSPQNCLYLFLSSFSSLFILIPSSSSVYTNSPTHIHNHVRFEVHPQGPRLRRPLPRLRYTLRAHYSLTHHLLLSPSFSKISFSSPVLRNWRFLARQRGKRDTTACAFLLPAG